MTMKRMQHIVLYFLFAFHGVLVRTVEHSRVDIDLDFGVVSGYSERVHFITTPSTNPAKTKCGRQAVVKIDLGGPIQVVHLTMKYNVPRLWSLHISDSLTAEGYGYSSTVDNTTTELQVMNQQLRVYTAWRSGNSATFDGEEPGGGHSQWMFLRVVDDTVRKNSEVELVLSVRGNTFRWQDERLAQDFSAPPGLFYEAGHLKTQTSLYISMNRIIAGDWRLGSGLCKLNIKLLKHEEECNTMEVGCDPNAVCKPTRKGYRCNCKKGWQGNGKVCRDINECQVREGGCVHKCLNTPGSFECLCYPGFARDPNDPYNCIDINECAIDNAGCEQECINTIGSYECKCSRNGVSFTTNQKQCKSGNTLCFNLGCQQSCELSHNLRLKTCSCLPGYQLNTTDGKSCKRSCRVGNGGCHHHCHDTELGPVCTCHYNYLLGLDVHTCAASCVVNNGGCQKRCSSTNVGVMCSCPNGYILNSDRKTCRDIDECVNKEACQHKCVNSIGSYECLCPPGFKLSPIDEKTCIDIDECELNDTCEHTCINTPGSYQCACNKGYELFGISHCGDVNECEISNGGCPNICVNTEGGFHCSSNPSDLVSTAQKECIDAFGASAKFLVSGIPLNQRKLFGQDIVKKIQEDQQHCNFEFRKMQYMNGHKMARLIRHTSGEIFQIHMDITCKISAVSLTCDKECATAQAKQTVCKTASELKESFNKEQNIVVRNKNLAILAKNSNVRQFHSKPCGDKGEKTRMENLCNKSIMQNDTDILKKSGDTHKLSLNYFREKPIRREQCVPGTFWNHSVSTCDLCRKNTYQENKGRTICMPCPENSFTDEEGSKELNDCKRIKCRSYINELSGFIESPNFPGEYPINSDCTWILKPPKRRRLLVIVPEIHLAGSKCEDYLVMRKSKSPYSPVTFEACKTIQKPIAFIAQTKTLWIHFQSNNYNNSKGFHISFVTYNEEYQSLIEDIVQDSRLYAAQNHLEILKDRKLLGALMEVIAQPINYYKYESEQRKMFPSSFIRFMTPKVRKFFSYR